MLLLLFTSSTLYASSQESSDSVGKEEDKIEYSFLWGLFKSKDYTIGKKTTGLEFHGSGSSELKVQVDTINYEQKRALWGIIQWSKKKEKHGE